MYAAIDIGGTKTLIALFSPQGQIKAKQRFLTPPSYSSFLSELGVAASKLPAANLVAIAVAAPGRIDYLKGSVVAFGNLPWTNTPLRTDLQKMFARPVWLEHDVSLAGLSEAQLIKEEFKRVLFVTISTGIGAGVIINGKIDPNMTTSEGGHIILAYRGKLVTWESFASGKAILQRWGLPASKIKDKAIWKQIAHNISLGLLDLIPVIQPEVIVFGGGVGAHFSKFEPFLIAELKKYQMPLAPMPAIRGAVHPEEAVLYGCYELLRQSYA